MIKKEFDNQEENKFAKEFADLSNKAKSELGSLWDIMDAIQSSPKRTPYIFPFGDSEPKPYGWYCK